MAVAGGIDACPLHHQLQQPFLLLLSGFLGLAVASVLPSSGGQHNVRGQAPHALPRSLHQGREQAVMGGGRRFGGRRKTPSLRPIHLRIWLSKSCSSFVFQYSPAAQCAAQETPAQEARKRKVAR